MQQRYMAFIFFYIYIKFPSLLSLEQDFSTNPNRTYPTSCCESAITDQISISHKPLASAVVFRTEDDLKDHQRNMSEIAANVAWNHVIARNAASGLADSAGAILSSENKIIASCRAVYPQVVKNLFL